MPEIISFVSPKGGCGATYVCSQIWRFLAETGKRVLAADLCGGCCSLDFAIGMHNDSVYNISDVAENMCDISEAACVSEKNTSASFLRGDDFRKTDISKAFEKLKKSDYDYVVADVPGYDSKSIGICAKFSDRLVFVTDCTEVSVKQCSAAARAVNTENAYVIINKIIPSFISEGLFPTADEILDSIGIPLLGLVPFSAEAVINSSCGAEKIFFDAHLSEAFKNISLRIAGEKIPAVDFSRELDYFDTRKIIKEIKNRRQ